MQETDYYKRLSDLLHASNIRERAIEVLLEEIERIARYLEKELTK